jgi:hypothetical protein
LALVIVPAFDLSRLMAGRLRFEWLVVLNVSQRSCARLFSDIRKKRESARLIVVVPGPSSMLRPELP